MDKHRKFLDYINTPLSWESIVVIYDANNIKFERCQLFNDFVQSFLLLVFDTYMGDDVTSTEQQVNHFNWCWHKNIDNFKKEGISFEGEKLYDYFLAFMLEVFYPIHDKPIGFVDKSSLKLWNDIFDYNFKKTNSDLDTFLEIYKIFEKSLI